MSRTNHTRNHKLKVKVAYLTTDGKPVTITPMAGRLTDTSHVVVRGVGAFMLRNDAIAGHAKKEGWVKA